MMRTVKIERSHAVIELSSDELEVLGNALNEVCHGLDVSEFSIRIGAEKPEVLKLMHRVQETLQSMEK